MVINPTTLKYAIAGTVGAVVLIGGIGFVVSKVEAHKAQKAQEEAEAIAEETWEQMAQDQ